jgi:hypothetical protein
MSFLVPTYKPEDTHPLLWINQSDIAALITRRQTTHLAYWNDMISWTNSHLGDPLVDFEDGRLVYMHAFALAYLLDSSKTQQRDKAIAIADYMATNSTISKASSLSGTQQRAWAAQIAFAYDWLYSHFSSSQHSRAQQALEFWMNFFGLPAGTFKERFWGDVHGRMCYGALITLAITNDSSNFYAIQTIRDRLEAYLDEFDDGTADAAGKSFWSVFRFMDDSGAGCSHKGSGPDGYVILSMQFYSLLANSLKTAVGIDMWASEAWLRNLGKMLLWTWRGDRTWHRDSDNRAFQKYEQDAHIFFLQSATYISGTYGENCQWMANEMQALADLDSNSYAGLWGPYNSWQILWNPLKTPTQPTLADMNAGKRMKVSVRPGRAFVRKDWSTTKPSWNIFADKYIHGTHHHKFAGHFTLAVQGQPIFFQAGHYDPNDAPGVAGELPPQHHRYGFYQRIPSKNTRRIFDTNEPAENSMEYRAQLSSDTIFVRNDGGVRWPKDLTSFTGQSRSEVRDLAHLLSVAGQVWWMDGIVFSQETSEFGYIVCDLTKEFYSAKRTRVRRHFLFLWEGTLTGIPYDVLMIYDDVVAHVDHVKGNQTTCYQLNSKSPPTPGAGGAADLLFSEGNARVYHRVLTPAVVYQVVGGYLSGQEFWVDSLDLQPSASARKPWDDSVEIAGKNVRTEIFPATYNGTLEQLSLIYPASNADGVPGAETPIDEAGWIGGTFPGSPTVSVRIRRASPSFEVQISTGGGPPPDDPPATPGQPTGVGGDTVADIDWPDNLEGDLERYRVQRRFCEP